MKLNIRMIDNTEWITNIFTDDEFIYFTDARFNLNQSIVYSINKGHFFENLQFKADLGRVFLANPLPFISKNNQASRDSDVEIVSKHQGYLQKYFSFQNKKYLSFLKNEQVYTELEEQKKQVKVQILQVLEDKLLGLVNQELCYLDQKLQVIKNFNIKSVNAIFFNNQIIYQNLNNEIFSYSNKKSQLLKANSEFVSIFYLNNNNIIISYRESNKSTLLNIKDKTEADFIDFYLCRAVMIDKETLLCKPLYNVDGHMSLNQKILIIS